MFFSSKEPSSCIRSLGSCVLGLLGNNELKRYNSSKTVENKVSNKTTIKGLRHSPSIGWKISYLQAFPHGLSAGPLGHGIWYFEIQFIIRHKPTDKYDSDK